MLGQGLGKVLQAQEPGPRTQPTRWFKKKKKPTIFLIGQHW